MLPVADINACQELAVPAEVMHHVVNVESSFNPYAIGVVGGRLVRQPKSLPEALATVGMLEEKGYNFSIGLAQVNRYNLAKYGLGSYQKAFETCPNLQAGSRILAECFARSNSDWGKSLSCYYSGNFTTGYRHGYVQKVYASMRKGAAVADGRGWPEAIPVIGKTSRRKVPTQRYSSYSAKRVEPPLQEATATADPPLAQAQAAAWHRDTTTGSSEVAVDEAFVF